MHIVTILNLQLTKDYKNIQYKFSDRFKMSEKLYISHIVAYKVHNRDGFSKTVVSPIVFWSKNSKMIG